MKVLNQAGNIDKLSITLITQEDVLHLEKSQTKS